MAEQTRWHRERESVTPGMVFTGFFMGAGVICGIWYLSGVLQVLARMFG